VKKFIIVQIYEKGDKSDCGNCGVTLLSTYKILSSILSRWSPYVDKIIEIHQYGFRCNRSTVKIFCIHQILEKEW
jgi:hypothetical protein